MKYGFPLKVMLAPVYYIILDAGRKLCEIGAEAAYPDNEIPVIIRILFGGPQFIGVIMLY
jgi:hypothetical protein